MYFLSCERRLSPGSDQNIKDRFNTEHLNKLHCVKEIWMNPLQGRK